MPTDLTAIHREHVEAFVSHLLDKAIASTAATRYNGPQQLFRWLTEEGDSPPPLWPGCARPRSMRS
jgi:hypothetical protein